MYGPSSFPLERGVEKGERAERRTTEREEKKAGRLFVARDQLSFSLEEVRERDKKKLG